jgi:hypothetical protein
LERVTDNDSQTSPNPVDSCDSHHERSRLGFPFPQHGTKREQAEAPMLQSKSSNRALKKTVEFLETGYHERHPLWQTETVN